MRSAARRLLSASRRFVAAGVFRPCRPDAGAGEAASHGVTGVASAAAYWHGDAVFTSGKMRPPPSERLAIVKAPTRRPEAIDRAGTTIRPVDASAARQASCAMPRSRIFIISLSLDKCRLTFSFLRARRWGRRIKREGGVLVGTPRGVRAGGSRAHEET